MGVASFFALLVLFHLVVVLLHLAEAENISQQRCPLSFECGIHGPISFPFTNTTYPECGLGTVYCDHEPFPKIQFGGKQYDVISPLLAHIITLHDPELQHQIKAKNCDSFNNLSLPYVPSNSFRIFPNLTLFKCTKFAPELDEQTDENFSGYQHYTNCLNYTLYYKYPLPPLPPLPPHLPPNCSAIQMPMPMPQFHPYRNADDLFELLAADFSLELNVSDACNMCHHRGGRCLHENYIFRCVNTKGTTNLGLILGTAIPGSVILVVCLLIFIIWRRKKWNSSYFFSRNTSSDPSSRADIEGGIVFFGVPVFPYTELEEATKNFDPSKELGDGGFGIVYYGKLRDGREVAVKRLYEKNYKQVEQFMNEIEILTCLRHRNLVTLYGCTSRHSRELLLVYEYIPNGTVADHIHGDPAKSGPLTWPIRMNIAIETACALAYLHASDIIHRDVKTNNILLDNNFCVKVADFGLSRLCPINASHISTAPQGTPGYMDPEYHECYQLTDKSDVYSLGVVLIELISSMPAVDISRHWDEINLADLAINRIQNGALNQLVDLSLGFESDAVVERMITSVAELAFRCLQREKELRPAMNEVLEALKEIRGEEYQEEKTREVIDDVGALKSFRPPPPPNSDGVLLLKYIKQPPSHGLVGLPHTTPVVEASFHSV
uniref:Protein kinase domain-containing protein n=1 Tax=Davidia involucrata TaxID=16924 RepID=A0A5B7A4M1_DAVIN